MKYLVLNQLIMTNLHITNTEFHYKLKYKVVGGVSLLGIPIHLSNCYAKRSGYFILLYSKDIHLLQVFDLYMKENIDNYTPLFEDESCDFIRFNTNRFTEVLLQQNINFSINLNIKYIKKGYINKPIVHIIHDN